MQATDAQVVHLIQPSKISEILKTTLTGGLYVALLLANDGSLVAGASVSDEVSVLVAVFVTQP